MTIRIFNHSPKPKSAVINSRYLINPNDDIKIEFVQAFTDEDNDSLDYELKSIYQSEEKILPEWMQIDHNSNTLIFKPSVNNIDYWKIQIKAKDSYGGSAKIVFEVEVYQIELIDD